MTGQLEATSGDVVVNGTSIREDVEKVRSNISLAPQANIFFDDLTVVEHLIFYADLRGMSTSALRDQLRDIAYFAKRTVESIQTLNMQLQLGQIRVPPKTDTWEGVLLLMHRMGLLDKLFASTRTLSGGMKRRLWLVIALIGNPSVVFLDEPTSGVDPLGRQFIWEVLEEQRSPERCIIITTHHMEEADLLAERKAVMAHGRLQCLGSSLFLKTHFGIGYFLEVQLNPATSVADASLVFERLLDVHIRGWSCQTDMHKAVAERESILVYALPMTEIGRFGPFLNAVENQKATLGISEYGISLSSLEEVFFKLGDILEEVEGQPVATQLQNMGIPTHLLRKQLVDEVEETPTGPYQGESGNYLSQSLTYLPIKVYRQIRAIVNLRFAQARYSLLPFTFDFVLPLVMLVSLIYSQRGGRFMERLFQNSSPVIPLNDYSVLNDTIPVYIDPTIHKFPLRRAMVQNILSRLPFNDKLTTMTLPEAIIKDSLIPRMSGARDMRYFLFHENSMMEKFNFHPVALSFEPRTRTRPKAAGDQKEALEVEHNLEMHYIRAPDEDKNDVQLRIFWNPNVPNAMPVVLNGVTQALMQLQLADHSEVPKVTPSQLGATSAPYFLSIPLFVSTVTQILANILSLGIASLPTRFGIQVISDNNMGTKHSMIISGLRLWIYWLASVLSNWLVMAASAASVLGFIAFMLPIFRDINTLIVCTIGIGIYCFAMIETAYLATFFLRPQGYGLSLQIVVWILGTAPAVLVASLWDTTEAVENITTQTLALYLHIVFSFLIPPYTPIGLLIGCSILLNEQRFGEVEHGLMSYLSFQQLPIYAILGSLVQCVAFYAMLLALDSSSYRARQPRRAATDFLTQYLMQLQQQRLQAQMQYGGRTEFLPPELRDFRDADVKREAARIQLSAQVLNTQTQARKLGIDIPQPDEVVDAGSAEDLGVMPMVMVDGVSHCYFGENPAVQPTVALKNVSFGVDRGEIFGLLGPNGAGKTTTINLLTCNFALEAPAKGGCYLGGVSVLDNPEPVFSHLGMCPQFDALWEDISILDNLEVFASIKNYSRSDVRTVLADVMSK